MLAELSRMIATAEFDPPPQSEARLVNVGPESPAAINISTAIRRSIRNTSCIRLRRLVF